MLPWTKIEPKKWMDCPPGSIIVIDECQFVFPKKPNGSKLPEFYEKLAIHRHNGYDIFLITQNPTLVDNFVRGVTRGVLINFCLEAVAIAALPRRALDLQVSSRVDLVIKFVRFQCLVPPAKPLLMLTFV